MPQIIPTAEPFFFPGDHSSKVGCLLVHGFTGAPKEMRWMGEYLAKQGYSVLGVRLAGHATRQEDIVRARWTDWTASVEDGYNLLRGAAQHVYLIGLSMGGTLSLLMSTRLDVRGVVAMSTPYRLPVGYPYWVLLLLSKVMRYQPKAKNSQPGEGWFDQTVWQDHISYPENPVHAAAELKRLLIVMRSALPEVRVPVLLIHSKDDNYVEPENAEHIYEDLVNARDKTKLYLTGSGHVVTRDARREQVFEAAHHFIHRLEAQS